MSRGCCAPLASNSSTFLWQHTVAAVRGHHLTLLFVHDLLWTQCRIQIVVLNRSHARVRAAWQAQISVMRQATVVRKQGTAQVPATMCAHKYLCVTHIHSCVTQNDAKGTEPSAGTSSSEFVYVLLAVSSCTYR
jgi:hypothetical protein